MADEQTEKSPRLSDYGGGYIREDQWITERLCALIAKKDGSELPDKFWNFPKWQKLFRRQVQLASGLLLLHDCEAIASCLRDRRAYNLRSFAAFSSVKFFSSILEEHQNKFDIEKSQKEIKLTARSTKTLPTSHKKDNRLSRLKNIDGETRPIQSG